MATNAVTICRDEGEFVFKNTLRAIVRFRTWEKAWPVVDDALDSDLRFDFRWAMAHLDHLKGVAFTPPGDASSGEELEAAYQCFLDLGNLELLRECAKAVNALHRPLADAVERPDETLTPEQQADPN